MSKSITMAGLLGLLTAASLNLAGQVRDPIAGFAMRAAAMGDRRPPQVLREPWRTIVAGDLRVLNARVR